MNLFVNIYTPETLEAVYQVSSETLKPIMATFSYEVAHKDGGTLYSTKQLFEENRKLRLLYPDANILLVRGNAGPRTISKQANTEYFENLTTDCTHGIDIYEFGYEHLKLTKEEFFPRLKDAYLFAKKLNPNMSFAYNGNHITVQEPDRIIRNIEFFTRYNIEIFLFSVNSKNTVIDTGRSGFVDYSICYNSFLVARDNGILLRESCSDYLTQEEIKIRKSCFHTLSLEKELGHGYITTVLSLAEKHNITTDTFLSDNFRSKHWKGHIQNISSNDEEMLGIVSGYKNYDLPSFKSLYSRVSARTDLKEELLKNQKNILFRYFTR